MKKIIFLLVIFFFTHNLFAKEEYFLTLRNEIVNLRQGPSFDYPVKIFYKKKFLPVLIQDKSDTFRKIRDHENNSGWIHISQLSKKKAAITIDDDVLVFNKPTIFSIEEIFYSKNVKSSLLLGHARGVAMAAASVNNILVYEYAARKIKQSLTGNGNAHKDQVQFMVKNLLKMNEAPKSNDASDALGIALCYLLQNKLEY